MTDPRIAVLAAISSPDWHPVPEAHGMPWEEAVALLDAYDASRAAQQPAPVNRGDIVREAISHLRNVNISCTALTGPVWYGTGWNEAITHLEEVADWMTDEGQSKTELITVDEFARALNSAQVWFHKGEFPAWEELSKAPGRGQDEVRMVARWLLKRLFVAEREQTRCTVQFEGGNRCTKPAGHHTPQNQDPHTPGPADAAQQPEADRG